MREHSPVSGREAMYRLVLGAALLAAVMAPGYAQDAATIQKLNEGFVETLKKGDFAALAGMYTEDAHLLPAGADMIKGRSAIQAFWTKTSEGVADFKLTTLDVKPLSSDAAREIGTFKLKTRGSQPQEVAGKYVVIWQKVGSDWKLATDIWNTNQ
jgi:uncharacterized protein (TIGR02246 family)